MKCKILSATLLYIFTPMSPLPLHTQPYTPGSLTSNSNSRNIYEVLLLILFLSLIVAQLEAFKLCMHVFRSYSGWKLSYGWFWGWRGIFCNTLEPLCWLGSPGKSYHFRLSCKYSPTGCSTLQMSLFETWPVVSTSLQLLNFRATCSIIYSCKFLKWRNLYSVYIRFLSLSLFLWIMNQLNISDFPC